MHSRLDYSGLVSRLVYESALDVNLHGAVVRDVAREGLQGSLHIDRNVRYLASDGVVTTAVREAHYARKRQTGCDQENQALLDRV